MNFSSIIGRAILVISVAVAMTALYWGGLTDVYRIARDTGEPVRISLWRRLCLVALMGLTLGIAAVSAIVARAPGARVISLGLIIALIIALTIFSHYQHSERHHSALHWVVFGLATAGSAHLVELFGAMVRGRFALWQTALTYLFGVILPLVIFSIFGSPREPLEEKTQRQEAIDASRLQTPQSATPGQRSFIGEMTPWHEAARDEYVIGGDDWDKEVDGHPVLNQVGQSLYGTILGYILAAPTPERAESRYAKRREAAAAQAATKKATRTWNQLQLELFMFVVTEITPVDASGNPSVVDINGGNFTPPSVADLYDMVREPDDGLDDLDDLD